MPNEAEDDYDPFAHREVAKPLTNIQFLIHLLKGAVGTGILAMPGTFIKAGLFSGTIILTIAGVIAIHCLLLAVKVQNDRARIMKVPIVTYGQAMKYALQDGPSCFRSLAPASLFIIDVYLCVFHMGTCIVYVLFVAVNVQQVFAEYVIDLDERLWMAILFFPMILLNSLRDLKILAPVSTLANIIMFTGLGIIMYYALQDIPPFSERLLFGSPLGWPELFGTSVFSLSPIAVVLTLESQMMKPQYYGGWCGLLNYGMSLVVILNIFVAFFGFLKYGDETRSSISLNIPQDSPIAHVVRSLYATVIFMSYPLQLYVPYDIIWFRYAKPKIKKHELFYDYLLKYAMVITTFVMAVSIPLLGLFLSLVGVLKAVMAIAFPALMSICHYYPDRYGPYKITLWKDICIFIIGVMILVTGTVSSVYNIYVAMKKYHHDKQQK